MHDPQRACAAAPLGAPVTPVSVNDGLPLRIILAVDVPAEADGGRTLQFTVADDVRVGDAVVIAKGAAVTGENTEAAKKKFHARGTKRTFRLLKVESVDGHGLSVRTTPIRRGEGGGQYPADGGKGAPSKEFAATRGMEYIAYIDGDQTVSVRKQTP